MAKAADTSKADAPVEAPVSTPDSGQQAPAQPQAQPQQVQVDDGDAISLYANFCRVTGTPEELLIDFGLNQQPMGVPKDPIKVKQRIIVNFYTAKRLLAALSMSVQRHEQVFGVLETDIQNRVQPAPGSGTAKS